jgi:hypothetical protein
MLRKVVDSFPANLEKFFERIIEKVDVLHKEDMAQTFLVKWMNFNLCLFTRSGSSREKEKIPNMLFGKLFNP